MGARAPRLRFMRLLAAWVTAALAVYVAAWLVPGVHVEGPLGAFVAAAFIALLNALLPPLIAALRLPFMLVAGFLLVLLLDAWIFKLRRTSPTARSRSIRSGRRWPPPWSSPRSPSSSRSSSAPTTTTCTRCA